MVILLGLSAAVLYGTGDFLGGPARRRSQALLVLALAETAGVIVALPAAAVPPGPGPRGRAGWRAWPGHLRHRAGGRADEPGRAGPGARREGRTAPMRPGDAAAQAAVPGSGQLRRQGLPPTGHRNGRSRATVDTVGEGPRKETR